MSHREFNTEMLKIKWFLSINRYKPGKNQRFLKNFAVQYCKMLIQSFKRLANSGGAKGFVLKMGIQNHSWDLANKSACYKSQEGDFSHKYLHRDLRWPQISKCQILMAVWAFSSYHQNNQLSILYHFKGNFEKWNE